MESIEVAFSVVFEITQQRLQDESSILRFFLKMILLKSSLIYKSEYL